MHGKMGTGPNGNLVKKSLSHFGTYNEERHSKANKIST